MLKSQEPPHMQGFFSAWLYEIILSFPEILPYYIAKGRNYIIISWNTSIFYNKRYEIILSFPEIPPYSVTKRMKLYYHCTYEYLLLSPSTHYHGNNICRLCVTHHRGSKICRFYLTHHRGNIFSLLTLLITAGAIFVVSDYTDHHGSNPSPREQYLSLLIIPITAGTIFVAFDNPRLKIKRRTNTTTTTN